MKNDKPQMFEITLEEEKDSDKLQWEVTRNTKPIKKEMTYSLKSTVQSKPCIPIKLDNFHTSRAKGTGTLWYSPILTQIQYRWSL